MGIVKPADLGTLHGMAIQAGKQLSIFYLKQAVRAQYNCLKVAGHYVRPKTKMSDPHSYANVSPLTVGYETTLPPNIPDSMHVSPLTFKFMTSVLLLAWVKGLAYCTHQTGIGWCAKFGRAGELFLS